MKLIIHSDGGARGNPGPAAYGVIIQDESGKQIAKLGGDITSLVPAPVAKYLTSKGVK